MDKLRKCVGKIMYRLLSKSEDAWYAINKVGNWLITKQSFRIILCGKKHSKILRFYTSFFRIKRFQVTLERLAETYSFQNNVLNFLCPFIQRSNFGFTSA